MKKIFIGIDNGVSGTIGIIDETGVLFTKTPVKSEQNYTKKKGNITRVNVKELKILLLQSLLIDDISGYVNPNDVIVAIERPMVNPTRFQATTSALRALEATLNCIEELELPYIYLDSKEWQKELLPKGVTGTDLKKASLDIGARLFPQFKDFKHEDRDGLLMAEFLRRKYS